MIISKLNLSRFNHFASVIEFKTRFVETMKAYETLRRTLSKISRNSEQKLISILRIKISKTAARWRRRRENNNDPTSTLHRPHIDPTSTLHRPHIDPTSTLHRPYQNNQNEEEKEKQSK